MAASRDLFARRNRWRIAVVVVVAALNYVLAVALAAAVAALTIVVLGLLRFEILPSSFDDLRWFGWGLGGVAVVSFAIGIFVAMFRIPSARRKLEHKVLIESEAVLIRDDSYKEVRNLLEGLAIAAGILPPRFAVIRDASPNSFSVGTRSDDTIVGITTGLQEKLTRDELEAILAYEVSRIRSLDVALSSWTVALTGGALAALDDSIVLSSFVGYVPRQVAERLQVWALRDQGTERDRAAVRFTRNPGSLIRALRTLDADSSEVGKVSRATAPLWVEFPPKVLLGHSSKVTRRLAASMLLDERIAALEVLAHEEPGGTGP